MGGSSSQGSRPSQGGVVFSVSLDLDTKAGLGEVLMQNDNMYSENQVFLSTRFGLNQTKKRIHVKTQFSSRLKFAKGKHGTNRSILEPQKWRGSGFGVAAIKRAFEGKTHFVDA